MPDDRVVSGQRVPEPPSPTMRDVLAVLFRQRLVVLSTFLAVLAGTLLYGCLAPSYQAHMKLLLRRGRIDPVVTSEQSPPVEMARPEISEEELNSEVELLRDESLLRKVVEINGLSRSDPLRWLSLRDDSPEIRAARAVRRLAGRLKTEPVRKSNLIRLSYEASDPAQAARVLGTLARLYVEKHTEVHRPAGELPFFEQQTERSRGRLDEAESQLLGFSSEQGVVSAALERDLALQRVGEFESSHQQAYVAILETIHRIRALESKLASLPERSTAQVRTSDNPQLQEVLKGRLLELELKRTELLTKYEPSYRLVREVEEQIAQTRGAIATEELRPIREETTEKDPNYEWAKAELDKAQIELSTVEARERGVATQLAASRTQAQRLGQDWVRQQDLLRGMKTAEENYLLYASKSEEARIGDALDERGIVNVAIAEAPVAPVLPKHSVWAFLLIGIAAGATTSTGLAFAVDYLDPAFRTPDEVAMYLNAPVLASLPREAA